MAASFNGVSSYARQPQPAACTYDCSGDKRIWENFEKYIPNPAIDDLERSRKTEFHLTIRSSRSGTVSETQSLQQAP